MIWHKFGTNHKKSNKKALLRRQGEVWHHDPRGIRTLDRSLRRRMLYPAELSDQIVSVSKFLS